MGFTVCQVKVSPGPQLQGVAEAAAACGLAGEVSALMGNVLKPCRPLNPKHYGSYYHKLLYLLKGECVLRGSRI